MTEPCFPKQAQDSNTSLGLQTSTIIEGSLPKTSHNTKLIALDHPEGTLKGTNSFDIVYSLLIMVALKRDNGAQSWAMYTFGTVFIVLGLTIAAPTLFFQKNKRQSA
jgi:hypothetical protein